MNLVSVNSAAHLSYFAHEILLKKILACVPAYEPEVYMARLEFCIYSQLITVYHFLKNLNHCSNMVYCLLVYNIPVVHNYEVMIFILCI